MTVIGLATLSDTIVRGLFRDSMRADAANNAGTIRDPKTATRPAASQFVVTAFPARDPYYPMIIVEEANDSGGRIERTDALELHTYQVRIRIRSEIMTDLYKLRDQVRKWLNQNYVVMAQAGYCDVDVVSSTSATWDATSSVKEWQITVSGKAYAS